MSEVETYDVQGWTIESSNNCPIMTSKKMDELQERLGVSALPEMIFDGNQLVLTNHASGVTLRFEAIGGLQKARSSAHDGVISVKYAKEWKGKQHIVTLHGSKTPEKPTPAPTDEGGEGSSLTGEDLKEHSHNIVWTFQTEYNGEYTKKNSDGEIVGIELKPNSNVGIDYEMLRDTTLPILFNSNVTLFEDELHDSGVSKLYVRFRVMPTCFLVLLRHWLRVDEVKAAIKDTRVFHKFGDPHVVVEETEKSMALPKTPSCDVADVAFNTYDNPDELQAKMHTDRHEVFAIEL